MSNIELPEQTNSLPRRSSKASAKKGLPTERESNVPLKQQENLDQENVFPQKENEKDDPEVLTDQNLLTVVTEPNPNQEKRKKNYNMWMILAITFNASIGFFFFGYNLIGFNTMQENLTLILEWGENKNLFISLIAAINPIGGALGAFFSGKIASALGRRNSFFLYDILGIASSLVTIIKDSYAIIIGKFFQGFCMGAFSALVPLYISEYVPTEVSGLCGVIYNTIFAIAILLSQCLGLKLPDPKETSDNWWRFMFAFSAIFNCLNIIFLIFFFKSDTPKFLIQQGNFEEAKVEMRRIYLTEEDVEQTVQELLIEGKEDIPYSMLCSKKYAKRLAVCIILNIFQQLTLINAVGMYSNLIFLKNIDIASATMYSVFMAVAELVSSICAIFLIERLGRKLLFISGFLIMFAIHLTNSLLYHYGYAAPQRFLIIFFYFMCGLSVDPIIWIYNADVLPDRGVGICAMVNWLTSAGVVGMFPFLLSSRLDLPWTFLTFSFVTLGGAIFILFFMRESKGKTQQEIESDFNEN